MGKGPLAVQALKTKKARRTLALPQTCLDSLRTHRTRQLQERLKAGAGWVETGLVFTTYSCDAGTAAARVCIRAMFSAPFIDCSRGRSCRACAFMISGTPLRHS